MRHFRPIPLVLALVVVAPLPGTATATTAARPRAASSFIALTADDGSFLGGTRQRFLAGGTWSVDGYDRNNDGPIDSVLVTYQDVAAGEYWSATFSAPDGEPLVPKTYVGTERSASVGTPGLDVAGDGTGCNMSSGSFTVLAEDFDTSNGELHVDGFAARFEFHCEHQSPAFYGIVSFNAPAIPFVVAADYAAARQRLTLSGENLTTVRTVLVDGAATAFRIKPSGAIVVKHLALAPGTHTVVVESEPGARSPERQFPRDPAPSPPTPRASELSMTGVPDDYVLGDRTLAYRGGRWSPYAIVNPTSGKVVAVRLDTTSPDGADFFSLNFSTPQSAAELTVGTYAGATRYPFNGPDAPGLDIGGDGRGCNELSGSFVVTDIAVDYSQGFAKLVRFAASFEQHCEHRDAALTGHVSYAAPVAPRILSAAVDGGLRLTVADFRPSGEVYVDGKRVAFALSGRTLVIGAFQRTPGPHAVSLVTADGVTSIPFVVSV